MRRTLWGCGIVLAGLVACSPGGPKPLPDNPFAPGIDTQAESVDGLLVGHRLMEAKQYDLALDAYRRAAASEGLTGEVLNALGTVNLALGRLGQAESLLRQAVEKEPEWPEAWNNLGVVLIESGKIPEATEVFRKAYALDNGQSDSIRDNLRVALAKRDNSLYIEPEQQDYELVRRGSGSYVIRSTP